jgi:hypothetical protein
MSREIIPFYADDVSALARALKRELARHTEESTTDTARRNGPGHVELLNMLARATGFRNFQHMRAQADARDRLDRPLPSVEPAVDYVRIERLTRYFDAAGRLMRWPGKHSDRVACLWVLWSRLAPHRVSSEAEINAALNAEHLFGDHALLRRDLVDLGLMARTPDGREYRRVEKAPPAEAVALIRHLGQRRAAA